MAAVVFAVAEAAAVVVSVVAEVAASAAVEAAVSVAAGFMAEVSAGVARRFMAGVQTRRLCGPSWWRLSRRARVPWRRHAIRISPCLSPAAFYHRHHFHRRFYAPRYYGYPYYHGYRHRYCRVIWTHYGPRKICRFVLASSSLARSLLRSPTATGERIENETGARWAPVFSLRGIVAVHQSLPCQGLTFHGVSFAIRHCCPVFRRPMAEARGFLGRGREVDDDAAWTGAATAASPR